MISTLFMKTTNNSTMNGTISRKSSMENVRQRRRSEEFAPVSIEKRFSFLNPKNFFHRTITPKKELQEVSVAEKHRPKMRKLSLQAKGSVLSLLKRRRNSIISTIKCVSSDVSVNYLYADNF